MNIAKNMEAIFVTALALVSVTSFATAAAPAPRAPANVVVAQEANMVVITMTVKRLTPEQKAKMRAE